MAAHTIFELAPVRSRSAELVGYELIDPRLPERNGLFQPLNALRNRSDLAWGRREADAPHAFEVVDSTLVGETPDEFVHSVLEVGSTCDHYAEADRAIGVQTFEVLKITIEERVLVVPLDLKSDRASGEWADVVHFMTLALQRPPVDNALDDEVVLAPPLLPERAAQPLRAFVSPPPEPTISSIGIVEASRISSISDATSGKSPERIAHAWDSVSTRKPHSFRASNMPPI
jgi:hypothetical protein